MLFIALCLGCDSFHRVSLKVPLEILPAQHEKNVGMDENEVKVVKRLMDDYAIQELFVSVSALEGDFDYYYKGYDRRDGPWRYGFYYIIDIKASILAIHFHQWGPGPNEDPKYEERKEDLIQYLKDNFPEKKVLINPENCKGEVLKKLKVKLHERASFSGLFQREENPEYWDLLKIIKDTLSNYRYMSSNYENQLVPSYSIGRITGYGPEERQIVISVSGGGFTTQAKIEIRKTDCRNQFMDEIDIDLLYENLTKGLKTEFGDDAIKEFKVK